MFEKLINKFKILFLTKKGLDDIDFIKALDTKYYPKILKKVVKNNLKTNLNLSSPKTFIDKIQWLKLYDTNPLKQTFTDKYLVMDWLKEQIGSEYLVPVLQICNNFDEINFDTLPEIFTIKTNHAEKWEYKIKNKEKLLQVKELFNFIKHKFDNWQKESFHIFSLFEMQYKGITPKLIIEEATEANTFETYNVYCFNGEPLISELIKPNYTKACVYDKDFKKSKYNFNPKLSYSFIEPNSQMQKAFEFSKKLSKDFKFVCVEWHISEDKLYFNRMNFAPQLGLIMFEDEKWNKELGELIKL